jgi:hypothetical protein
VSYRHWVYSKGVLPPLGLLQGCPTATGSAPRCCTAEARGDVASMYRGVISPPWMPPLVQRRHHRCHSMAAAQAHEDLHAASMHQAHEDLSSTSTDAGHSSEWGYTCSPRGSRIPVLVAAESTRRMLASLFRVGLPLLSSPLLPGPHGTRSGLDAATNRHTGRKQSWATLYRMLCLPLQPWEQPMLLQPFNSFAATNRHTRRGQQWSMVSCRHTRRRHHQGSGQDRV